MQDDSVARRRVWSRGLAIVFGALLLLMFGFALWNHRNIAHIARNWRDLSEGSAVARQLRNPIDILDYIAEHPDQASLVAYQPGDEAHGIFLNADEPRPLASTFKLLILCEYAAAVERGELRPDEPVTVADWEAYELPNTDGGAHALTLAQLRASRYLAGDTVQLQDLVYGMIRFSDNAAADYLMSRLGSTRVLQLPQRLGLGGGEESPLPVSGMFLSWESTRTGAAAQLLSRYRAQGRQAYVQQVFALAESLRTDPRLRAAERERLAGHGGFTLRLSEQAELARVTSPHGTARAYAALMARIQRSELSGSAMIRAELQWPLQLPALSERFEEYGTKGGSLPSVVTAASFAKAHGEAPRVCALFFTGLPMAVWLELMHSALHQRFEQALLFDDAFFERARARLSAVPGKH